MSELISGVEDQEDQEFTLVPNTDGWRKTPQMETMSACVQSAEQTPPGFIIRGSAVSLTG